MQYIDFTVDQIIERTRREVSDEELLSLAREARAVDWKPVTEMETRDLLDGKWSVDLEFALIDGEEVEGFSMIVTTRFRKDGYVYFSNGSQATSLRRVVQDTITAVETVMKERGLSL